MLTSSLDIEKGTLPAKGGVFKDIVASVIREVKADLAHGCSDKIEYSLIGLFLHCALSEIIL